MNKFTKEMVDKYANDLLIGLTEEENKMVLEEFEIIDKNCDIVANIEGINEVIPMTHALDEFVVELRDDVYEDSPSTLELLFNADKKTDNEVVIERVVG